MSLGATDPPDDRPEGSDQDTIHGIAEALAREKGGDARDHWTEALSLHQNVFSREALLPPEDEEQQP